MHRSLPLIPAWDDHELADGAWREGATEHKPERVRVEWHLVETVLQRTPNERRGAVWQVRAGSTRLERIE
jgi:hypothetical protein